jgi:hypothetical protein
VLTPSSSLQRSNRESVIRLEFQAEMHFQHAMNHALAPVWVNPMKYDLLSVLAIVTLAAARPGVNITWGEFTDASCKLPLGTPAPALVPLDQCNVVPEADPNAQWRGSSYRLNACLAPPGKQTVVEYSAFVDSRCTKWFTNWTLSRARMNCVKVPPGPNATAPAGRNVWHSVLGISCIELPS